MFEKFIKQGLLERVEEDAHGSPHIVQVNNIKIYEEILNYCKQNNLFVSNVKNMIRSAGNITTGGAPMLLQDPAEAYSSDIMKEYNMNNNPMHSFIIYGSYIFKHANTLANQLAINHTPFVELFTTLKNRMFSMKINGESGIITFIDVRSNISQLIKPIAGKWLPPNIELQSIYHKLYSPQHYGERDQLFEYEKRCWEIFNTQHNESDGDNTHSREFPFNSLILTWLKNKEDCVLIGPVATTHPNRNKHMIQIITSSPMGKISDEIKKILQRLANIQSLSSRTYLIDNIPGEYRLSKTVIFIKKDRVVEIYNSGNYELIPYIVVDDVKVGMPNVLLHYLMLDIWSIGVLGASGILPKQAVARITNEYIDIMKLVRSKSYSIPKPMFLGTYDDDHLAKKRLSLSNNYFPYYPAQYKQLNNKYREI